MAFRVLIGKQEKGGSTVQQEKAVELAALNLEGQLNSLPVKAIHGVFVHDLNPLHTEVIAIVDVEESKKKEK